MLLHTHTHKKGKICCLSPKKKLLKQFSFLHFALNITWHAARLMAMCSATNVTEAPIKPTGMVSVFDTQNRFSVDYSFNRSVKPLSVVLVTTDNKSYLIWQVGISLMCQLDVGRVHFDRVSAGRQYVIHSISSIVVLATQPCCPQWASSHEAVQRQSCSK